MNVVENISLKPYNTFGIDVSARYMLTASSLDELTEAINFSDKLKLDWMMLGGGSNILFTKNYDGLIIKNELSGINLIKEDEEYFYVKAAAGVVWHQFVLHCIHHNYAGIENLSLIPGTVGAAPLQNIGAYGVELKDVFL